jgi:hypothetical protein
MKCPSDDVSIQVIKTAIIASTVRKGGGKHKQDEERNKI